MLERINPLLRLVCLALVGLILFQASRLAVKRDVVARSSFEAPAPKTVSTNSAATNTTTIATNTASGTNVLTATSTNAMAAVKTNGPAGANPASSRRSPRVPAGMRMGMGGPGGGNVPPEIQSAVDKIKQSQALGVEMKPPPMALMGIAGKDVFLRGPDGQTGVVREGESLGSVKIVRIGINRVLVEENGEQKELTLYDGFGSETLLPQKKDKSEPPQ